MEEKRIHNRGITAKLRMKFEQSPGMVLYLPDLADEFQVDRRIIQQSISNLRREHGFPEVHIPAGAWIYRPGAVPKGAGKPRRVFEEVGITKTGELIIQADDMTLYRATEI